jgi:hypothetical protein
LQLPTRPQPPQIITILSAAPYPPPRLSPAPRLPLSPEASCLSFGAFLQTCFNASALEAAGRPLHSGFVRYLGLGRTVLCIHQVGARMDDGWAAVGGEGLARAAGGVCMQALGLIATVTSTTNQPAD